MRQVYLLLLVVSIWCPSVLGEWDCSIKSGKSASDYQLGDVAKNAIRYPSGQSSTNFKAVECTCDGSNEHDISNEVETALIDKFNDDWKSVSLIRLHDCKKAKLTMIIGDVFDEMDNIGPMFIIENIEELYYERFDIAKKGKESSSDGDFFDETFSSFYMRDVNITESNGAVTQFEEKAEVVFQRVNLTFKSSSSNNFLAIEFINGEDNSLTPTLRIESCNFGPGPDESADIDLSQNVESGDSRFQVYVKNIQRKLNGDDPDCFLDYKSKLIMKKNKFQLIYKDNIQVEGADEVHIMDNTIDMTAEDAFDIYNARKLLFQKNNIGITLKQPIIATKYEKKHKNNYNDCNNENDEDDLKEGDVSINLSENMFKQPLSTNPDQAIIKIDKESDWSDNFVRDKFKAENLKVHAMCDCNYEKESSPNDKELVIEKIMSTSHCTVQLEEGEIAQGKRTDICNGNLPPSKKEREDEIRRDTEKEWTVYVIVGVVVTLIVTAIVTALVMKMCCGGNRGDVSP